MKLNLTYMKPGFDYQHWRRKKGMKEGGREGGSDGVSEGGRKPKIYFSVVKRNELLI